MPKKYFVSILTAAFFWLAIFGVAGAKQDAQDIPEASGTYDVPGKPAMKVRVFVHNAKEKAAAPLQCSVNDPASSSIVGPAGWKLPAGEWKYFVNSASAPLSVGSYRFYDLTLTSFDTWRAGTEISPAGVNMKYAGNTTLTGKRLDGKNIVAFGSASGSALGVTYTWYYPSTGLAVETDTILNKKFAWSWAPYSATACPNMNAYDAQNILTHEIGHWIGLNDHYTTSFANNTMYGYGAKGEIKKDTLTRGDIDGVAKIY